MVSSYSREKLFKDRYYAPQTSVWPSLTFSRSPSVAADIDDNGKVDHKDLLAISRKLNTLPGGDALKDINNDGTVDVLDLAIAAQYFGWEAKL